MLADPVAEPEPKRDRGDAGHEIEQQQRSAALLELQSVGDEDQKQGRRQAVGDPVQEVGAEQPAKRPVAPGDREFLAQGQGRAVAGVAFGHQEQEREEHRGQQKQHAPGERCQDRAAVVGRDAEQHRQAGGEQDARDHEALAHPSDARALVIVARQLGAPCGVRNQHQRPGEVGGGRPQEEVAGRDRQRRTEQQPGRAQQQRAGEQEPGAAPAEARAGAIAELADQRVAQRIEQAGGEQQRPDRREAEAGGLGVERRQIDVERQVQRGERQTEAAIGQQADDGYARRGSFRRAQA